MRQILTALVVLAGAAFTCAADDEKYKSKDGKFEIQFPAGTKVEKDTKKTGGIDMNFAIGKDGEKAFIAMYMDLPAAAKDVPAKTILDGAEKGSVSQSGGKVDSSKDIEFGKNKYPGREFVADKDGNKTKTRVIIVETRVYVIAVGGPKDFATTKDGTKFLDSFEITK
jgi:hypothetical protein